MRDRWEDDNERKIKYFQKCILTLKEKNLYYEQQKNVCHQKLNQIEEENYDLKIRFERLIIENQELKAKNQQLKLDNEQFREKNNHLENYYYQFHNKYDSTKSEILNVAYHNSNLIVAKAIKIASNFKMRIENLLYEVEQNQTNGVLVMKIITEFLKENREIFLINTKNNDKILNEVEVLLHQKLNI